MMTNKTLKAPAVSSVLNGIVTPTEGAKATLFEGYGLLSKQYFYNLLRIRSLHSYFEPNQLLCIHSLTAGVPRSGV